MAQTRQQIVGLLEGIGRAPNHRLGQHFMIDANLVGKLVGEAGLEDDPIVLEVGPGTGTLTEALLESRAELLAVELDEHLVQLLGDRLAGYMPGQLHLLSGDVLAGKHELNGEVVESLSRLAGGGRPVRLVANLPYQIASPLVAELIGLAWRTQAGRAELPVRLDRLLFTVQREVADRLTAAPGGKDYGPLSVLCQGLGRVEALVARISPNAFYPRPNVHSAMLRIDLAPETLASAGELDSLKAWLEAGFAHRRKTLSASIRLVEGEWSARLTAAARALGVDLARRGETLAVEEFLALARAT